MAELVGCRQERTIPEYELIRKHKIMTEERLRAIIRTREAYQYKLSKGAKSLRDYGVFVVFEKKLHEMIKSIEISRNQQFPGLRSAMANRIIGLYKEAIRFYPEEVRLWDAYLKFCKNNFPSEVPVAYEKLIQKRGDKPKIWNSAAMWFHEQGNNIEKVKSIFFRGLQRHPDSELLFTSFFRVLLTETSTMPEEHQAASLGRVIAIYNTSKKKICNVKFLVNLIKQCQEEQHARFTQPLQKLIINDMMMLYPREETVWDVLARRVLNGDPINDFPDDCIIELENDVMMEDDKDTKNPIPSKATLKSRIEGCFKVYQTAVNIIKTQTMWGLFIKTMLELNSDLSTQAVLKRKKLACAFRGAHEANCMSEDNYFAYISLLTESKSNKEFIIKMMNEATRRYNMSLKLWEQRLAFYVMENNRAKVYEVFREATDRLGDNGYSIWKLTIQFFMTCYEDRSTRLQLVFREACARDGPQFIAFRPQFLEWSICNQPLPTTRLLYEELKSIKPPCYELHQRMILLESQALKPDVEKIRNCYENSLLDFGKTRTDVWIDYIKFERDLGEPKRVSSLCERAKNILLPLFVDNFITEHCLLTVGAYK